MAVVRVFVGFAVGALVANAAPAAEVCTTDSCRDQEGSGLLQVASGSSEHVRNSADGAFSPLDALKSKVKYCVFGTLCAEQTSHVDFTKLGALCVVATHGDYNPAHAHLPEGTCASVGFTCAASSDTVAREMTSPAMLKSLPSMAKVAAELAREQMQEMLRPMEDKVLKAMRDDIRVFTAKSGYQCPQ